MIAGFILCETGYARRGCDGFGYASTSTRPTGLEQQAKI